MATKQEGSSQPTDKQRSLSLSNFSRDLKDSWIGRNWQTVLLLAMMVFLALFVRSYFGFSTSVDNGYLVSGGSDSYYHMRVIDHAVATGDHLVWDDMLNYPNGMRNPRPPLYDWSVAVVGMLLSTVTGLAVKDAIGMSLVFSTAVWGALTVVPVYMLGRAAFGRKAGMLGAFIFALMAGHIERTVLSNADHDAIVLFFVVFSFYFLLRSLQSVNGSRWVSKWTDPKAILPGLKSYLRTNQLSLIYAALGGLCVAAVGLIWTGYTYLLIVVFVYFIVQLLVDRFRNADSMGVLIAVAAFFGIAFLVMAPAYVSLNLIVTWFDTPLSLFAIGMVGGLMFVVTRDYPWTLVLPVFTAILLAALALLSVFNPALLDSIMSGQGYLVKSKLYDTISEAQAPMFSNLAMSFGMVTFWLALIGVGYAVVKIPKNLNPSFIFVVVWVAISIYMASSAARFVFNASPAFAVSAGWMLGLIIDRLKFDGMIRGLRTDHGGLWKTIRTSVKIRHVLGAFFIIVMILVPNVWYAVDAGIPSTTKNEYDAQVYHAMPDFLRPDNYDLKNGTNWYLGAFSYGLTLPNQYWPVAWKWFAAQDTEKVAAMDRPAFVSWWDYGFEAIQEGGHPAVADNFQNGYNFAGTFLMTQTEDGAIAMFIIRSVEYDVYWNTTQGQDTLDKMAEYGVDTVRFKDIMMNPANYVDEVKNNPAVYGEIDDDLSPANARYIAARQVLTTLSKDQLVSLYNDVREITGNDIGYVSVDSRLFPFTATSYNIFYAPAKLSDQRVDGNNIPYDYYTIYAVDIYGDQIPLDQVTSSSYITSYEIVYTEAFYDTMLYRAFMGYGPSDIGETKQGLPGISGSLQGSPSMQGWNMSNFRLVYRTAYYNPYSSEDVANHTDAWRAVSYDEAISMYNRIQAKELIGTVDLSSSGLYSGVTFLQYYDGAIVKGQAVTDAGRPMAGIWVTVLDEYGIPHQVVKTDSDGRYSVIVPFGEVTLVYSYGDLDPRMLYGTQLHSENLDITYDQAMRVEADVDKNDQLDYLIDLDVVVSAGSLVGQVFLDNDGNGKYSAAADEALIGATVTFANATNGFRAQATSTADGYEIAGISPMSGTISVDYQGHVFGTASVQVRMGSPVSKDLYVEPAGMNGTATLADGTAAGQITISLLDRTNGQVFESITDSTGAYAFDGLLAGNYTIQTPDGTAIQSADVTLGAGDSLTKDLVLYNSMRLSGLVSYNGNAISNAMVGLSGDLGNVWVQSDSRGRYSVVVPKGDISLYATATVNGQEVVFLEKVIATDSAVIDLVLTGGMVLSGTVQYSSAAVSGADVVLQDRSGGATLTAVTNSQGKFRAVLPSGLYFTYINDGTRAYWGDVNVVSSMSMTFQLLTSVKVSGKAWYDADGNDAASAAEGLNGAVITVTDQDGRSVNMGTSPTGQYSFVLVSGRTYALTAVKDGFQTLARNYPSISLSVTDDLEMVALQRTVTGSVSMDFPGDKGNLTVKFVAVSGPAMDNQTVTNADGTFSAMLYPGKYIVLVNQNVTAGDPSVRYQSLSDQDLEVLVGSDPSSLQIELVKRSLVSGAVSPSGTAKLVFDGPDKVSVTAGQTYSLYLQDGSYNLYATVSNGSRNYAALSRVNVTGATPLNITTSDAAPAIIQATMSGARAQSIVISIELAGAYYNVTTPDNGQASVYLPVGSYVASVEHSTILTTASQSRFVKYVGEQDFTMSGSRRNVAISTVMSFENATVSGIVTADGSAATAQIEFQAMSATAQDLTVSAVGSYAVGLSPGNYTVYAINQDSSRAYLGKLSITDLDDVTYDIVLVEAFRLSGVTFAQNDGVSSEVSVNGMISMTSSSDGAYEIYLPGGSYTLYAETALLENGLLVDYQGSASVSLSDVTSKGIYMQRVAKQKVSLTWDPAQKVTLNAGETATYTIRIVNDGNLQDTFRLTSTATGWTVVLSQTEVTLGYGASNSQTVTVQLTPSASVLVKHTAVIVRAVSITNSSAAASVSLDAVIAPARAVSMAYQGGDSTKGDEYVHTVAVTNAGNVDDTYAISIGNQQALRDLGWEVRLVNKTALADSLSVTVAASKSSEIEVSMVPLRSNPSPTVTVQLVTTSSADQAVRSSLDVEPQFVGLDGNGLTVTGVNVEDSTPTLGQGSIVLLGLALALMAVLIVLSMQKGVFSRRKR
ncbi:MAG TPA: STT3 domain-containing protein [Methanomassiliicoccales archaeon]|nr:STT3 domain-containing protein [Methanomassiliicoccales archaeon]